MAFKSYADGRGFKDFQLQLPDTTEKDRAESNRKLTYLRNDAERIRRNKSEELAAMRSSARDFDKNRDDIKRLRDDNQKAIMDAERRNYETEIKSLENKAAGGGGSDPSFFEKIEPLLKYGTKLATMVGKQQQEQAKARYNEALNVLVGTGLTTKQKAMLDANEKEIYSQTTEGVKLLYDLNKQLGRTGDNAFTVEHLRLLSNQSGENQLLLKHQLALNSFKKLDRFIQSNSNEVDPATGMSFNQAFDAAFNGNPEFREQAWNRVMMKFHGEQGISLNELPASIAGGSYSSRVQKLKDIYFGTAGRGDTQVYKEQQKRDERLSFEQGLFSVKQGENTLALKDLRDRWAGRSFTLDGKPNYPLANEKLHKHLKEGITAGLVGPSDIQDVMDTMGDRFGHGMMGRMVALKHESEVHRARTTGDGENIKRAGQIELSNNLELHLNTNAQAAEIFQALSQQEQVAELRNLGMEDATASKFLSKMYGGKAANKAGSEINQGGQYDILKEWVPQILANQNEIAESDLKKVLGHEAAEQALINIATQAYNQQWDQTHNGQESINYAKSIVDEVLERGRFDINKDDVKINGEFQTKSIDGTGALQYSFGAYHRPGERPQLDITKAKVTAAFTGKTEAEGLDMVIAISSPESAAAIMPRSVIEDSMVGGKFNLNIFGRHAAVQRALEETGASVSYLADQLLQGYGLEGLDPKDVATPQEIETLGQFERSTYYDRNRLQSSISQDVNRTQLAMNQVRTGDSGMSTGPHLDYGATDAEGNEVDPVRYLDHLYVGDTPLKDAYPETSAYGWREHPVLGGQKWHAGRDIGTPMGTEVTVRGGEPIGPVHWQQGYGWSQIFRMPDGGTFRASHLQGDN